MSVSRIYANENFPFPVVEALRRLGHDILTTFESGNSGRAVPDEEVLAFAIQADRILITLNRRHFVRLHQQNPIHAGIIVCTVDSDFQALANRIHQAIEGEVELRGKLIRVNRPSTE